MAEINRARTGKKPGRAGKWGVGAMPMQTKIRKTTFRLVTGDIAEQDTDAVVTAAH